MKTHIGCSGYYYADWVKKFYPEKLPKKEWLPYYAKHFNTVEINNTFYRMMDEKKIINWKNQTPGDFKFTIKANRYFTHQKKLNIDGDFRNNYHSFIDTIKLMKTKLGCILWQLPGSLHKDEQKLEQFLNLLDARTHHVIEFRHESWFSETVYSLLRKYKISCSILSAPENLPEVVVATTQTAYMRFHGKTRWYNYQYSPEEMNRWYSRLKDMKNVERLYVYFNNDHNAWAVENAYMLKELFE